MAERSYGTERRDDFYSVLDDSVDEEISPSTVFGDNLVYDDVVVSGWLTKPNANVGHHVHRKDRSFSDIPYELANMDDEPEELSREGGNIYLSGPIADSVKFDGDWRGAEAVSPDEDVGADLYMVGNISGDICVDETLESFHGADIVVAEFLLDRDDVHDEGFRGYVLEEFVVAADKQYDSVFGVGEWSDDRVYVVAKDESEEPEPGEATAEMRFPPGSASGEKAKTGSETSENREETGELEERPTIKV